MFMLLGLLLGTTRFPSPRAHHTTLPRGRPTMTVPDQLTSALAVHALPTEPSPELTPKDVVNAICTALQHCHTPSDDDGLRHLYAFTTFECRCSLTTRKGAFSGIDKFVEHAEVYTLKGCLSFALVGEPTLIPGTMTRGAICTISVDVSEALTYRGPSGFERHAPADSGDVHTERYRFQLSQERRPPLQGCWLVTSVMPNREHMIFNGDTGVRAPHRPTMVHHGSHHVRMTRLCPNSHTFSLCVCRACRLCKADDE